MLGPRAHQGARPTGKNEHDDDQQEEENYKQAAATGKAPTRLFGNGLDFFGLGLQGSVGFVDPRVNLGE